MHSRILRNSIRLFLSHPRCRHGLAACVIALAGYAVADAWQGVYYQDGHPGNAVEFEGTRYAIRTHEGGGFTEGAWEELGNARVVSACCHDHNFQPSERDELVDDDGARWTHQPPVWPLQNEPRVPLTIQVVDEDTNQAIPDYSFRYSLASPKGTEHPNWVLPRQIRNEEGTVTIEAPMACELNVEVDSLDYLCHGSGVQNHTFVIQPTNTERRAVVRLKRGLTVEGVVVDADTGKPVAGARVAPLVEYHPSIQPNIHRKTFTDEAGRFRVHAARPWSGIHVGHAQYCETKQYGSIWEPSGETNVWQDVDGNPFLKRTQIHIKKASRLTGTVRADTGEPVANVSIQNDSGREVRTQPDGRYEFYSESGRPSLRISHPHYIPQYIKLPHPTNTLDIVLRPQYSLSGRVLKPDGSAVENYTLVVGDNNDYGFRDSKTKPFTAADGRFSIEVNEPVTNIVSVSAPGFAPTHTLVVMKRDMPSLDIVMQPGVVVSGTLIVPESVRTNVVVSLKGQNDADPWRMLLPEQWRTRSVFGSSEDDSALRMADREAGLDAAGGYRFEGVPTGSYTLSVSGQNIVPEQRTVRIPETGRRLPDLEIAQTAYGTVTGQVFDPYLNCLDADEEESALKPWSFADGTIWHANAREESEAIRFKADEQGRFCVSNVPAGPVSVGVYYNVTFDIIEAMHATGVVHAAQSTKINVKRIRTPRKMPEEHDGTAVFQVTVGDGSEADFAKGAARDATTGEDSPPPLWTVEAFFPVNGYPCEFDENPEKRDIHPTNTLFRIEGLPQGTWYARLVEFPDRTWQQMTDWETPTPFEVQNETQTELKIVLPPHSIRGTIKIPEKETHWQSDVYVIDAQTGKRIRSTRLREKGRFAARFLPAGRYDVLAYHPESGWGVKRDLVVEGACDIGNIPLQPGAKLIARIYTNWAKPHSDDFRIHARDTATGIAFDSKPDSPENGGEAAFEHLWPGSWEITLTWASKPTLFSTNIVIGTPTTVVVDLPYALDDAAPQ